MVYEQQNETAASAPPVCTAVSSHLAIAGEIKGQTKAANKRNKRQRGQDGIEIHSLSVFSEHVAYLEKPLVFSARAYGK